MTSCIIRAAVAAWIAASIQVASAQAPRREFNSPDTVVAVEKDSLVVSVQNGGTRRVDNFRSKSVFLSSEINVAGLKEGQNVMALASREDGARRAVMINVLSDDAALPMSPPGAAAPVFGRITGLSPFVLNTKEGSSITLVVDGRTRVFKDERAEHDDIRAGDKVQLFPDKIVVLPRIGGPGAAGQDRQGGPGQAAKADREERSIPVPPDAVSSRFDRSLMDRHMDSPFGFKDPNMLRVDVLSWFDEYGEVMNDLGVYWMEPSAIWGFNWNLIQSRNADGSLGAFDWERYDRLVRHVQSYNIHISAKIHAGEPASGEHFTSRKNVIPALPSDMVGYRAFVRAVVERYNGDGMNDMPGLKYPIKFWKIEDEVMAHIYWRGTGADYAALLVEAYAVIKEVDPDAAVICSMVRGYPGLGDPRECMLSFYDALEKLGRGRCYDVMDQHWMVTDPDVPKHMQYRQIEELMKDVNATAASHGFEPAPFVALETAGLVTSDENLASDLIKRYIFALSCGVRQIFWSGIKSAPGNAPGSVRDKFSETTIMRADGEKKPAYLAFKKMVEVFDGSDWSLTQRPVLDDNLCLVRFLRNGSPVWAAWRDSDKVQEVVIDVPPGTKSLLVTDAVPSSGAREFEKAFRRREVAVETGKSRAAVPLYSSPVYIEIAK